MRNPWLDISAADYLGHMGSPEVDQLAVLSRLLGDALARFRPRDLLLLGCSTGNGLEQLDTAVTHSVTGVDINPEYLRLLGDRYRDAGFQLNLHCVDVASWSFPHEAFDLVHSALLFEYLDWSPLLERVAKTLRNRGTLSVVLQCPSAMVPAVTPSAFGSLSRLESLFRFVDPEAVAKSARACGFELEGWRIEPLVGGKSFVVLYLRKMENLFPIELDGTAGEAQSEALSPSLASVWPEAFGNRSVVTSDQCRSAKRARCLLAS